MSLAVTGALLGERQVGLRAEDGRVVALGPEVEIVEGDEVLDATGTALVPGLVNGHTHAAMTLFRGYGDDMPLMEWLERRIWPAEARLTAEDVYWGTRLACLEMARGGTVAYWDMYWHAEATARAVADSGLRAVIGAPLVDRGEASGREKLAETARRSVEAVREVAAEHEAAISPMLAPHAIYTVTRESLEWIAEFAAETELPVQIHLSETEREVADCIEAHGERPAQYLDRIGLLGSRTILAHGVWLDESELELIAERGATVVTNPVANMKLASGGPFPYPAARARNVHVGLGTDGAGSNNSLDLLADAKHFALIQKHAAGDPAAISAEEVWEIAIGARSPLLATRAEGASISVGDVADFLLVRADAPELTPGHLISNFIYAASGRAVETTVVAGRVLMHGGVLAGSGEVRERALAQARRLGVAA